MREEEEEYEEAEELENEYEDKGYGRWVEYQIKFKRDN